MLSYIPVPRYQRRIIKDLNLLQPKYYEGSDKRMLEILGDCKRTGCVFLVGGRNVDGVFQVLPKL